MNPASVIIHPSQFPDRVRRELLACLRRRRLNPKFHYDSHKQTLKWLALHEQHSPARQDPAVRGMYDQAFAAVAAAPRAPRHVLGLGCGGGQKDARLLARLRRTGAAPTYTPSDVSVAMTLVARQAALRVLPRTDCAPFVCDLATARDLPACLAGRPPSILTFFGMIPNFEPDVILPRLAALVRPQDRLLFSANLAPGPDYAAGLRAILPQYDNPLTRDWLLTFLLELGCRRADGRLGFAIETGALDLQRVTAHFEFLRSRQLVVHGESFTFQRGERFRLFFSYRYTAPRVVRLLARHGLKLHAQWLAPSGEEGVFLCQKA